jgi:hypothetical protein
MIDATLIINSGSGERTVELGVYLDAAAEEAAHQLAYTWIKALRHVDVDGRSFRDRFTVRGDSLWWFSEIYLHKEAAILDIFRAIASTSSLIERERPLHIRVLRGSDAVRHVVVRLALQRQVRASGETTSLRWRVRRTKLEWRARMLALSAIGSRSRRRADVAPHRAANTGTRVAAFIHRAFWRSGGDDGSAESYIGPVLKALEVAEGQDAIAYVGVGPSRNFRSRSASTRAGGDAPTDAVIPVENYAPLAALQASRDIWRDRRKHYRLLASSEGLRQAAIIQGIDCWSIVREQLAGIASLQWPWSVRAMDEAGAALDTLRPATVLTYAEAGGWGRALMLEARRRNIPSVGLQHGFIYRTWLNYLHEPDEMQPGQAGDLGFPLPTLTLLFDAYAEQHLRQAGHYPPEHLRVTGSPRLDAMMAALASFSSDSLARTRREAAVPDGDALVLVTTKERQARHVLPQLVAAAESLPRVTLVIKPHPAETADAYAAAVAGKQHVRLASAAAPLAPLMAASRAVVTVNSTVALDAAVAAIPALVIGLPNNLSPFVDAGILAGAESSQIRQQLERILYDEGFRQQLSAARSSFLRQYAIVSTGTAAVRSAEAVIELMRHGCGLPGKGI